MEGSIVVPNATFRKTRYGAAEAGFEWLPPESSEDSQRLRIHVLFTTTQETQVALRRAADLSAGLGAEILLIVTQIVPFPLDIDNPPVPLDFASHQLCSMVESVDAELDGHIYLCRDRLQAYLRVLRPNSVTVLGTRRRWFVSRTERLARALRRKGHQVILETCH